jgi:hypothetical protein
MRPNAFQRYKYSGEYYKFVLIENGTEVDVEFYFSKNILLVADLDDNQRLTLKFKEPIPVGSLIANIKDSNNELILDDTVWQTQSLTPVFNVFNSVDYYRSRAIPFQEDE